jgi:hypothetical protein
MQTIPAVLPGRRITVGFGKLFVIIATFLLSLPMVNAEYATPDTPFPMEACRLRFFRVLTGE